jgi:hypothetical protein
MAIEKPTRTEGVQHHSFLADVLANVQNLRTGLLALFLAFSPMGCKKEISYQRAICPPCKDVPAEDVETETVDEIALRADVRKAVIASYNKHRAEFAQFKRMANKTSHEKGIFRQVKEMSDRLQVKEMSDRLDEETHPDPSEIADTISNILCVDIKKIGNPEIKQQFNARDMGSVPDALPQPTDKVIKHIVLCAKDNPDDIEDKIGFSLNKKGQILGSYMPKLFKVLGGIRDVLQNICNGIGDLGK